MSSIEHLILYASISLLASALLRRWNLVAQGLQLIYKKTRPPSPWSLPILGNLFSIPPGMEHIAYMKLGDHDTLTIGQLRVGDMVYLRLFGYDFVILNSANAAIDLLEKLNWSGNAVLLGYSDLWRNYRRIFNNWLGSRTVTQFHQLQESQAQQMLQRLANISDDANPFEENINQTAHYTAQAAMFTSTGWKRTAREWRAFKDNAQSIPYEWTKAQLVGLTVPIGRFILTFLLANDRLQGLPKAKEICLKEISMMIVAALVSFVAAIVLNPHVQVKAQEEIDNVLGFASLPKISDRERLPYVRNLIQEVLRWLPPVPADDAYRGYEIERGTVVAMTRDESVYRDPETFNPDRFMCSTVPHPPAFGWGRRRCAGIHFAEASLFITAATLLAFFKFSKKKDTHGQEITPQLEFASNSLVITLDQVESRLILVVSPNRPLPPTCRPVFIFIQSIQEIFEGLFNPLWSLSKIRGDATWPAESHELSLGSWRLQEHVAAASASGCKPSSMFCRQTVRMAHPDCELYLHLGPGSGASSTGL
ncbi:cytochrome P450 domain-containing protein [Rhizoctonia solani AG-1 IA]|uniref:Cytochrome P450 domain-containing protein n=1 Tax=Thanatephorus cucumeris (strain AG1-IA) TaxID=983506 RepID=L8WIA1_THACA|nr:cytochrome P450 domain-containing protein [Rhizoctonia solani AG-1 IA]